jgi:alpha-glutamyl/putrescinyl thymine pyrophosphorylase clade 1
VVGFSARNDLHAGQNGGMLARGGKRQLGKRAPRGPGRVRSGPEVAVRRRAPIPSAVFDTYWTFAAQRQRVFRRRLRGEPAPWSQDPVLRSHRFTNVYRAADRVSQYLIREVAYRGEQAPEELFLRVVLFKLFNRIETWELLLKSFGDIEVSTFDVKRYDAVLTRARARGIRIYSAAYIMPPAAQGASRKHTTHLELIRSMMGNSLPARLAEARSMRAAYEELLAYRGIGPFLAYQLLIDLNYTSLLNFSEMDFVVAGPGARSGLRKCFTDAADFTDADLIRYVADRQEEEFARRELEFEDLWGRPLQLVDCQNLFCEVDKYARVVHPEVRGLGDRTQIKQRFRPLVDRVSAWFPPKWGLNARVAADTAS